MDARNSHEEQYWTHKIPTDPRWHWTYDIHDGTWPLKFNSLLPHYPKVRLLSWINWFQLLKFKLTPTDEHDESNSLWRKRNKMGKLAMKLSIGCDKRRRLFHFLRLDCLNITSIMLRTVLCFSRVNFKAILVKFRKVQKAEIFDVWKNGRRVDISIVLVPKAFPLKGFSREL